jgi:FKBP-type peptidyl-prolyl cis-trans isomerase 2
LVLRGQVRKPEGRYGVRVGPDTTVTLDYTLRLDSGEVVDSSTESSPLTFDFGKGQIIPGLERELTGLLIGDQKEIHVAPEDGYGTRDPEASLEVPLDRFPDNITPAVGMSLTMKGPKGDEIPFSIVALSDAAATLDFNHPLAGKALTFSVTVREIQATNGTDRR